MPPLQRESRLNRPVATLDVFSPAAYLDEDEVARRCQVLRAQGRVLWVEQEPYRPFWAVLTREDVVAVERDNRT